MQSANQLYGIPLGYSNITSFGECSICGAHVEPMFDDALVPVGTLSFEALLAQTNPRLTRERIEVLLDVAGDTKARAHQAFRYFLSKQNAILSRERGLLCGGAVFTGFLLALPVLWAFHRGGITIGLACTVFAMALVILLQNWGVRRRAARSILPSLRRFLCSQGVSFDEFEERLGGKEFAFPKLRRHIASSAYDSLRMNPSRSISVPDDVASLFFRPQSTRAWV
ncbi:MAG: hypothetical protein LLG00_07035 [Planctomycetaceae bacterium]|nr:hypothetical protein [Planctomycetaceae bacterium]